MYKISAPYTSSWDQSVTYKIYKKKRIFGIDYFSHIDTVDCDRKATRIIEVLNDDVKDRARIGFKF